MKIQVYASRAVQGSQKFEEYVQSVIEAELDRFARQLTRVEVHVGDDNGAKDNGADKRCMIEARPAGLSPVSVTHVAGSVEAAIEEAAQKMSRLLDSHLGKLHTTKGGMSASGV